MDLKNIRALAKILSDSGLSAVEVEEGEKRIRLERNTAAYVSVPAAVPAVSAVPAPAAPAPAAASKTGKEIDFNSLSEFRSPIIGIFYAGPSPKDKPFVEVGSKVKKGDLLCIIEAMKVMNEIVSDRDGEIVDICAQNGQVVEYSQVLFKIF